MGMQFKSALESLADSFNIEFVFFETGYTQEQAQTTFETALQTGLDGTLMIGIGVAILEACKQAGDIPIAVFGTEPLDEQTAKDFAAYDNYIGGVSESNYNLGINAAEALYEAGCRKIGAIGLTPGITKIFDDRTRGFKDGVAQHADMEIIAENLSMVEFGQALSSFAAVYPEMDGVFVAGIPVEVYKAIYTEGLIGKVKLAAVDIIESTKDYFDKGTLVYAAGGQYGSIMISFAVLYNYLYDGTRLIPDTSITVMRNYIELFSSEDYANYEKVIMGDVMVYTPNEIAAMIKGFNPSFTYEELEQLCAEFSLADVAARHAEE